MLIFRARSNRIRDLPPVIPECLDALKIIQPRQVIRVGLRPKIVETHSLITTKANSARLGERVKARGRKRLAEETSVIVAR